MSLRLLFWLLMLLWLIFGFFVYWPASTPSGTVVFLPLGNHLIHFALFFVVGWKVFGFPIDEGSTRA